MTGTILITGAGTGLGLETALHLAGEGYTVYGTVLDESQRASLQAEATMRSRTIRILTLDITDDESIAAGVAQVIAETGAITALINNAGLSLRGYFEDCDDAEIRRVFDVNIFGTMAMTRAVLPHMRHAGQGRVIFISSVGGRLASMARTTYCSTKWGIEGFAESLMQELAPLGIRVSIIEPAIIRTERWTVNRGVARRAADPASPYATWFQNQEALADTLVRTSPTTPAEVAQTVHHALSVPRPRLRYIVGKRAALVLTLRRYIPATLFERIYFGVAMNRVTRTPPSPFAEHAQEHKPMVTKEHRPMQALLKAVQVLGLRQIFQSQKLRQLSDQTVRGYYTTRAIIALLNVGFFDELRKQGVINPQTFAQTHNLDLTVLQPLCDYLYQQHILGRDGDFYRFEATGRLMIEELEGAYYVVYAYEDVFYNLEPMLRREKQYGTDVRRRSHYVAKGSGGVGKLLAFPMVAELVQRLGYKCILDLGCGDATFLIDLCQRVPGLRAYGLDIAPEAVAEANVNIQRHGLQDRITPFVGDVTNITPELREQLRDVDAATSVYVIHEFASVSKELIVAALRGFRTAFPGKILILCEVMRHSPDEIHAKPGGIMEIQLFHELSRQRLVSRPEWHAYFHEAGFTNIREEYLSFARTMLFMVS